MRRRLVVRIGVFLLVGAIVNIAVAWTLVLWPDPPPTWPDETLSQMDFFPAGEFITVVDVRPGGVRLAQYRDIPTSLYLFIDKPSQALIPSWSRFRIGSLVPLDPDGWASGDVDLYAECAAGWPFLACRSWRIAKRGSAFGYDTLDSRGLWMLPESWNWGGINRDVPFLPIWPGFAINTLLYAAAIWLLFAAPFSLRKRWRIRRGRCPHCAYPVGAGSVCTECGKPVTPAALAFDS